jgi:hypothetical protein
MLRQNKACVKKMLTDASTAQFDSFARCRFPKNRLLLARQFYIVILQNQCLKKYGILYGEENALSQPVG